MNINDYQAGQYEDRYEYKAFVPELICHEWIVSDSELIELLGRADRALGELNAFSQLIPDIDFFIRMHVAKEATQSSRIEGTQTNIEDAFKDADDLRPEERDDWSEVQNYIQAINSAITSLETLPLSSRLLRETHAKLMQGVRGEHKQPGEFRVSQNWIGVSLKNAVFVPPHHDRVPDLMSDLEKFLHTEKHFIHPLLRIAIAHYQFETIHPFLDGNGRIGRLLITLYLVSSGILDKPLLYLSDFFEKNKTLYYDNLTFVRTKNDLGQWIKFFLTGIIKTAEKAVTTLKRITDLKATIEKERILLMGKRSKPAIEFLHQLFKKPVMTIKDV
ncbi:hypothetical protein LCGC14_2195250, partial [marine sediment metagenome]